MRRWRTKRVSPKGTMPHQQHPVRHLQSSFPYGGTILALRRGPLIITLKGDKAHETLIKAFRSDSPNAAW